MKLFLIIWEFEDIDRGCEWTHTVLENYPTPEQTNKIIKDFMLECHDEEIEENEIQDYWVNTVDEQDNYKIILEKK